MGFLHLMELVLMIIPFEADGFVRRRQVLENRLYPHYRIRFILHQSVIEKLRTVDSLNLELVK